MECYLNCIGEVQMIFLQIFNIKK